MNDILKELLKEGKTPDDIYKLAQEAEAALQEEKNRAAVVDKKREAALSAIGDYLTAIQGKNVNLDIIRQLERDFKELEKLPLTKASMVELSKEDIDDFVKLIKLFRI